MKKLNSIKIWIVSAVLILTAGLVWLNANQKLKPVGYREPASEDRVSFKDLILQTGRFVESADSITITLFAEGQDFCEYWSAMEITIRAEGVAYSGEPSRAIQTSLCRDQGFEQIWPKDLMNDHINIQKVGYYEESPPEWAIEKIKLLGPFGTLEVSGVEFFQNQGSLLVFEGL